MVDLQIAESVGHEEHVDVAEKEEEMTVVRKRVEGMCTMSKLAAFRKRNVHSDTCLNEIQFQNLNFRPSLFSVTNCDVSRYTKLYPEASYAILVFWFKGRERKDFLARRLNLSPGSRYSILLQRRRDVVVCLAVSATLMATLVAIDYARAAWSCCNTIWPSFTLTALPGRRTLMLHLDVKSRYGMIALDFEGQD